MQSLNVFVIGEGSAIPKIKASKFLNKLFVSDIECEESYNITFDSAEELVRKCKGLQIDIAVVEDVELMSAGLVDTLNKNHINCIGINRIWTQILEDDVCVRKLANMYKIQKPRMLSYPTGFPLVVKNKDAQIKVFSMAELLEVKKTDFEGAENVYLEEFIDGEEILVSHFYDGKNLLSFPPDSLNEKQCVKFDLYNNSLKYILKEEKAEFMGFFNSKLIWNNNCWYNLGFDLDYKKIRLKDYDFLYLLVSAIYQKLDEIKLS